MARPPGEQTYLLMPANHPCEASIDDLEAGLFVNTDPRSARCFDTVTVPEGAYLVLGDNRANSSDSTARCRVPDAGPSCWRWAHRENVVGRVAVTLWPLTR